MKLLRRSAIAAVLTGGTILGAATTASVIATHREVLRLHPGIAAHSVYLIGTDATIRICSRRWKADGDSGIGKRVDLRLCRDLSVNTDPIYRLLGELLHATILGRAPLAPARR